MIYTHVAAGLLGAALAALGAWQVQDWRFNARIAQMQAAHAQLTRQASEDARARETALDAARQKAEEFYVSEKRKAAAAARGARNELDGLRDQLYAVPAPTPGAASAALGRVNGAAPVERQLLSQCAAALVDLAGEADGLAARLTGLQFYVRATQ